MLKKIIKSAFLLCLIEGCIAMPKISGILSQYMGYEMTLKDTNTGMFLCIVLSNENDPTLSIKYDQCISENKSTWLDDEELTDKFLRQTSEELKKQQGFTTYLFIFIKHLSEEMEQTEKIDDVSKDILYMGLESAWVDLNDFAKEQDPLNRVSAISSVISYVKNKGDTTVSVFKKLLGRICYEHSESLSFEEKTLLNLDEGMDFKEYGLELLNQAAIDDSEAEDYLIMKGV